MDSETLLAAVAARTADCNAGIFGPASLSWKINRESALFLGAGRAALLQLAHPWVAAALAEHSTVMNRPIARFHNTFRIVFTMIFGSLGQALAAARHLYALHTQIRGELPEDVARWKSRFAYEANEIGALRWVFATLVESAVIGLRLRAARVDRSRARAILRGKQNAGRPFWSSRGGAAKRTGRHLPHTTGRCTPEADLGVSDAARAMAHSLLRGAGSWIRPPHWYRALTVEWLPERFRAEFGLKFGPAEQRASARARRCLPAIYRRLPPAHPLYWSVA